MRIMECPQCGKDISESHQSAEPDVGIEGGWYCEECQLAIPDYSEEDESDYERG